MLVTTSCEDESDTQPIEDLFFGDGETSAPTEKSLRATTTSVELNPSNAIKAVGIINTEYTVEELEFGFCYGKENNPTYQNAAHVEAANILAFANTNKIDFSNTITGLDNQTQYFVRAYAKSPEGVFVYGSSISVTTVSGVPVVKMGEPVYSNNRESVNFPSELVSLGNASSVQIGWLVSGNNDISLENPASNRVTTQNFSNVTSPLTTNYLNFNQGVVPANTLLYVRMYAINNDNNSVSYSNTVSFKIEITTPPFQVDKYGNANYEHIFVDDFRDNRYEWYQNDNNDNRFVIENGIYHCQSKDQSYWTTQKMIDIDETRNFEIETRIEIKNEGVDNAFTANIHWGFKDTQNSYFFAFTEDLAYWIVEKTNNRFDRWKDGENQYIVEGFNKLTVRKYRDKYYFFINENLAYSRDYASFKGNNISFWIAPYSTMHVDYLFIRYITN